MCLCRRDVPKKKFDNNGQGDQSHHFLKWDRGQALVPTLKINKSRASFLASVYGRGIVA